MPQKKITKSTATLIVFFIFILTTAWELIIVPNVAKRKEFTGTLVEKKRTREWWRGIKKPMRAEHIYYDYYWVVKDDEGRKHTAEVLWGQWNSAKVGDPIKKELGERWPVVDTLEALRLREEKAKAMGMILDNLSGDKK